MQTVKVIKPRASAQQCNCADGKYCLDIVALKNQDQEQCSTEESAIALATKFILLSERQPLQSKGETEIEGIQQATKSAM